MTTSKDPAKVIESIAQREKNKKKAIVTVQPVIEKNFQFPLLFGENTQAVSNALARSALFAAVKERGQFNDYVLVGEINGVKIEFSGEQFNQDDHDTLLQLVRMSVNKPYGANIQLPVNVVLRGMGRKTHQEQRRQLFEQIDRLVRGTIRLQTPAQKYRGHLVNDASTPQDQLLLPQHRRHLTYSLNPNFAQLFAETSYTLFDLQERNKLRGRGSELAKWLHLWLIGNAVQYPHKVETIRYLCGSRTKELFKFRQTMRYALDLLKTAHIISDWHFDDKDLVVIERNPTPSQLKHLTKKQAGIKK